MFKNKLQIFFPWPVWINIANSGILLFKIIAFIGVYVVRRQFIPRTVWRRVSVFYGTLWDQERSMFIHVSSGRTVGPIGDPVPIGTYHKMTQTFKYCLEV
jgi:hypothetical protein